MGRALDVLQVRLQRQLARHGIVVWYDPEAHYRDVLDRLDLEGAPVVRFEGSFFGLRHKVEWAVSESTPGRVLIYVDRDQATCGNALCELEAAGVVLQPGQQPPQRNMRLAVLAREALEGMKSEDLDRIVREVEHGQLSFEDVDRISERAGSPLGALQILYEATHPEQVALAFLAGEHRDALLVERGLVQDLARVLEINWGCPLPEAASPLELRRVLARTVLMAHVRANARESLPRELSDVPCPGTGPRLDACLRLWRSWLNRRDLQESYVRLSNAVEEELALRQLRLPMEALIRLHAFRCHEVALQDAIEEGMLQAPTARHVEIPLERQQGFWASVAPEILERWALLAALAKLLLSAARVEDEVRGAPADADELVRRYVGDDWKSDDGWCQLDTHQRHMERRYHTHFDLGLSADRERLERLVTLARRRHSAAINLLAERFLVAWEGASYRLGLPRQTETFQTFVTPLLDKGKVAYLLIDGLRYEMARELARSLSAEYKPELACTLGTMPSITEVGMAALMPGAEHGIALEACEGGEIGVRVSGTLLRNRAERLKYLADAVRKKVQVLTLDRLLPPTKKQREAIQEADLIVVTSTDELDKLGESGNVSMARRFMDDVISQVLRGLRVLAELGVGTAVITADHGHLFGEDVDSGNTIDAPRGETVDLHRRVWLGRGGAAAPGVLRFPSSALGIAGDLDIAVPRGIGCFRSPGKKGPYFHGGATPQEILVPVCAVRSMASDGRAVTESAWKLTLGSKVISAMFLSVQIEGKQSGSTLFESSPSPIRVEVRDGRRAISRTVAASYGFEDATGFVLPQLEADKTTVRPNTVTLMLSESPKSDQVKVLLLDAGSDRVLATLEKVPVKLAGF